MINNKHVSVVIPAKNEANAIGLVIEGLKALSLDESVLLSKDSAWLSKDDALPLIDCIVVCDNGKTNATAEVAISAGAQAV